MSDEADDCSTWSEASTVSSTTMREVTAVATSSDGTNTATAWAVDFATLIGQLKTTPRTGWVRRGVPRYESVADHSWRVAALSLLLIGQRRVDPQNDHVTPMDTDRDAATSEEDPEPVLDFSKCMQMAIIHDLAESLVGDIAPDDNVSATDKRHREGQAMARIATAFGRATSYDVSVHLLNLFEEYEKRETAEAKCVKDLDLLDMILQADEYERTFGMDLGEFFTSTSPSRFYNPWLRAIAGKVHDRRVRRKESSSTATEAVRSSASDLSPSDLAFIEEHSKASKQDRNDIAQVVRALRGWESRSDRHV